MDHTEEIDIDLKKIFLMMRKKVVYILLFTLLGGIVAGCFTEFFIDQKYTAKISLYVYSDMNQLSTQSSISYNDYTASTALVKSYLAVLESDAVLDKVAEKVGLTDGSTIKNSISTSQDEDTNVFYVSVTTTNPKTSQSIANAVAEVAPGDIQPGADGFFHWCGDSFSHIVWCTGWEAGMHPDMAPLKGRPSKGTILDLELKDLEWHAGILHFGHWLVHNGFFWRFGATYAWAWDAPGVPEAPAAVRPIIRRSQPVAGPIPGLERQFVFSGLGSKGVTTSPWTAAQLAEHLVHGAVLPPDLLPAALWK